MPERNGLQTRLAKAEKERDHLRQIIRDVTAWNELKFPSLTQILQRKDDQ